MAIHSHLRNLRRAILSPHHPKPTVDAVALRRIEILSFEVASLIYKLLQVLHLLSDSQLSRLYRNLSSPSAAAFFSGDPDSLLLSARAELVLSLRFIGESISLLGAKCSNPSLLHFKQVFSHFSEYGFDPHQWVLNPKEAEKTLKKVSSYLYATSSLYLEMEKFQESEKMLKNLLDEDDSGKTMIISNLKKTLNLKNQEIERLRRTSLWTLTFNTATLLLAKLSFTALFRLKETLMREEDDAMFLSLKNPSLSCNCFSSSIHPSSPEKLKGFFSASSALLLPPPSSLGAASLHLHYATIIIQAEKFLKYPRLIREGERDEIYSMLPERLRKMVRAKLREQGKHFNGERRGGLLRTMALLSPLARNTLRWQEERGVGQWRSYSLRGESSLVLLPQTLFFAEKERIEKSLVDILADLTLMWRLAMEMRERSSKP